MVVVLCTIYAGDGARSRKLGATVEFPANWRQATCSGSTSGASGRDSSTNYMPSWGPGRTDHLHPQPGRRNTTGHRPSWGESGDGLSCALLVGDEGRSSGQCVVELAQMAAIGSG